MNTEDNDPEAKIETVTPKIKKPELNPFFVEIDQSWLTEAKKIKEITKDMPLIKLSGDLLKIQPKSEDDLRAIQNYLDQNSKKYTTLQPTKQRPKKIPIRGLPVNTPQAEITAGLLEHGFTVTRAAMLKNRQTGRPMPLYMVSVLPTNK